MNEDRDDPLSTIVIAIRARLEQDVRRHEELGSLAGRFRLLENARRREAEPLEKIQNELEEAGHFEAAEFVHLTKEDLLPLIVREMR